MADDKKDEKIDLNKKLKEAKLKAAQKAEEETIAIKQNGEDELSKLREELAQMTETAKRTMADMQNLRRRYDEEKKSLILMANADLIKDILPILDNLNRAKTHMPKDATDETKEWLKGVEMSISQFEKILQDASVKKIESLGQKFNPDFHTALAQDKGEKDIVLEELESGYTMGDKVLRHAKVKVGNGE